MRSTTALLSLLAAAANPPVAFAAPIRGAVGSFYSEWERRLAAAASRASLFVHTLTPEAAAALADETGPSAIIVDNRHYTPSGDIAASAALAAPRPIVTTYLMSLDAPGGVSSSSFKNKPVPIRIQNTHEGVEVVIIDVDVEKALEAAEAITSTPDALSILPPAAIAKDEEWDGTETQDFEIPASVMVESQVGLQKARASRLPCHYAQMPHDYNDMIVISLVAIFLLVIVAVELWDNNDR